MIEKNQYDQVGHLVKKVLNEQDAKMPIAFFIRLKNGLNYMAYAEAHIPSKNISLLIHNYDYIQE